MRQTYLTNLLLILSCQFLAVFTNAQEITFVLPLEASTCQTSTVEITIDNTTEEILTQVFLDLELPCSIRYTGGSVTGDATEFDLPSLSLPVFALPDIAPQTSKSFSIDIDLPCSTYDCVNQSIPFNIIANLIFDGGNITGVTSNNFNVITPLLLFTQIDDPILYADQGEEIIRTITIKNTRSGPISSFIFIDNHSSNLSISSDIGTVVSSSDVILEVNFDGLDFTSVGDGDELFEFNEEIVLTETIKVLNCELEQTHALSELSLSWGCINNTCDVFTQNAAVIITEVEDVSILSVETLLTEPDCFCDSLGKQQRMTITNIDEEEIATNIEFYIQEKTEAGDIIGNSFFLVWKGETIELKDSIIIDGQLILFTYNEGADTYSIKGLNLDIGESINIFWNTAFVSSSFCLDDPNEWWYNYNYQNSCEDGKRTIIPSQIVKQSTSLISLFKKPTIYHGQLSESMVIGINNPYAFEENGKFRLVINIPCPYLLDNPDWNIGGVIPSMIDIADQDSIINVVLEYDGPMNAMIDSLIIPLLIDEEANCMGMNNQNVNYITSCNIPFCGTPMPTLIDFYFEGILILNENCPSDCLPRYCLVYERELPDLGGGSTIDETIPGYMDATLRVERVTLGLPDNDDDHIPDETGVLNMDSIRLDHAVHGDTVRINYDGVVIMDQEGASFSRLEIALRLGLGDIPSPSKLLQFYNLVNKETGFVNISRKAHIWDEDKNLTYNCMLVPYKNDPTFLNDTLNYIFDLSVEGLQLEGNNVPIDYLFEEGDSISLECDYVIEHNIYPTSSFFQELNILFLSQGFLSNESGENTFNQFYCGCPSQYIRVANIIGNVKNSNGSTLDVCYSKIDGLGHRKPLLMGVKSDFFPFEYKPTAIITKLRMPKIEGLELISTSISDIEVNGIPLDDTLSIEYDFYVDRIDSFKCEDILGYYEFSFDDIGIPSFDDNLEITFNAQYENQGCSFVGSFQYHDTLGSTFDYLPQNPPFGTEEHNKLLYSIRGKNHDLQMDYELCDATSLNDTIFWNVSIIHRNPTGCSPTSNPLLISDAPNIWLQPISPTSLVDNFKIYNQDTGEEYIINNGYFNFSKLAKSDTIRLKITAKNNSCLKENVNFNYGWSCEALGDEDVEACDNNVQTCFVISPPGVVDILPEENEIVAALCDTIPIIEVVFFNAGLGAVFDLDIQVQLPPGLSYSTGKSFLSWPSETELYVPIPDPIFLGNGLYEWHIGEIMDSIWTNGLPSVNLTPENTFSIRFAGIPDCDFISGSKIGYYTNGSQVCDLPTNSTFKLSEPIHINGVNTSLDVAMTANIDNINACEDTMRISIQYENLDTIGSAERVNLQLPSGLSFVQNSCMGDIGDCNPIMDGVYVKWLMPMGETSINYSFLVAGIANLDCETFTIPIISTATANALCVEDSMSCAISVVTSSEELEMIIEKPSFEMVNVKINIGQDELTLNGTLKNNGIENIDPIIMDVYIDKDLDGEWSIEDSLLTSLEYDISLDNGATTIFNLNFSDDDNSNICNYIIVIDENKNCVCDTESKVVDVNLVFDQFYQDTICSDMEIMIGVEEQDGYSYHWTGEGVQCYDCAETNIIINNNEFNPVVNSYTLIVNNGGNCSLTYLYDITVLPKLEIAFAPESVCANEPVTLIASESFNYNWAGSGIVDPTTQIISLNIQETSTYYVTLTNVLGCESYDSTTIIVYDQPIVDLGADTSVCFGNQLQFDVDFNSDWTYNWMPGIPFLDAGDIHNPTVLIDENTTFILSVDNGFCSHADTIEVEFYEGFDMIVAGNEPACVGDTIEIAVTGADYYTWSPFYLDMCLNSECSKVKIVVQDNENYIVTGIDNDGCKRSLPVEIMTTLGPIYDTTETTICEDEVKIIFGQEQNMVGIYCDTILLEGGCEKISCVELFVVDTILVEEDRLLCYGEVIIFDDKEISDPGRYCVTTPRMDACDSTYCINVSIEEEIRITDSLILCPGESTVFDGEIIDSEGEYCVEYIAANGCDSTICLVLDYYEEIEIPYSISPPVFSADDTVVIKILAEYESIQWSSENWISCDTCQEIKVVSSLMSEPYTIEVIDSNGCTFTNDVFVQAISACDEGDLAIPNAFTPNGNGHNDKFRVVFYGEEPVSLHTLIYNRWGSLVYESKDNEGWDGRFNGEVAPPETYIYIIKTSCDGLDEKVYKGDVTIIGRQN